MTGDRDMFQCATGDVKVSMSAPAEAGRRAVGVAEVKRRYGIPPKLVPDFIALRGDPSDGLPGAKGVGEKGAAELLRKQGSLEASSTAPSASRGRLRKALTENPEELLAFKEIATLREVKVGRPRSKRTDYRSAAKAARERGMNRLAERLKSGEGLGGPALRPPDQVGGLLADHDRRGVGVAAGDHRHHRGVGDAQPIDPADAQLGSTTAPSSPPMRQVPTGW